MLDFKKIEEEIFEFWKKNKIYEKLTARKGKNYFLLDGPPYANFIPHVGHIKNTVFKDLFIRMSFMKGFNALFQPGFDTHGLPVENMVEKKLNLQSKKDIEAMGIENFMKECKNNAALNKDVWMKVYKDLGSVYFLKSPYLTYENYYIESGWWSFHQMYKKGMVYEGEKPVMWCPHCETSLAGYEVTDSYKDVKDPGIYVLFSLRNSEDHLLVYTTTPWTLPANIAVAVAPEENYSRVEVNGKKIILAEKRLPKLSEIGFGYRVLDTFKGAKLVGKKYEPLLDVPLQIELTKGKLGKAHEVIASIPLLKERVSSKMRTKKKIEGKDLFEDFVTMTEGTGFVHTAPGHGKTDYMVGQHYKLACVSPVDDQCNMTKESGFSGFVKAADKDILERLKEEDKLLYHESIIHSYPLCWRCKSPLIFRLSKQLFFKVENVKKIILKENKDVAWYPNFARDKFENWVENAEDWNISRQRYWGIPIPLWECACGEKKVVESKEELEKLSGKKIEDLHAVENISFECKCGKQMKKFKGILDVWFDSGIAPWASMGYPHANKEMFETHFPVDRINEAQDQIRGWFYSLMFCSSAIFSKPSYKAVSMTGWVVDKKGDKMSKSVGNVVSAEDAIKDLGADLLRFYFCWDVAPYDLQKFNADIAKKEIGRLLNVLGNLKNLASSEKLSKLDKEDEWIISKLNSLIMLYTQNMESFEIHAASRALADFILNDLSRRYIQMTREKNNSAIVTLCLKEILKLMAPTCPFVSEYIWQQLRKEKIVSEESIHLSLWPEFDEKKIDSKLEKEFDIALKVIEVGFAERDKAQIGLKWPLSKATISSDKEISKELQEIIMNQLNVKKIEIKNSKNPEIQVEFDTKMTPELEAEGYAREISRKVQALRKTAGLVKENLIELLVIVPSDLLKILEKQKNMIKERTNSKTIELDSKSPVKKYQTQETDKIKEKGIQILFNKL